MDHERNGNGASVASMRPGFVGGTGRSGTTITARLIGAHPAFRMIPVETKFIPVPRGLCDVVDGRTSFAEFEKRMLGPWFYRTIANGQTRGLHKLVDRERLQAALSRLRDGLRTDGPGAARAFVHELFDPLAAASHAGGWFEMSPPNVLAAPTLARVFPEMKLVHSMRDGRDVACSVVGLHWGPISLDEAIDWWADKLEQAFVACRALPPGRVLTITLEDLVARDRETVYARLLEFLGVDDDPAMRTYFDTELDPGRAHIGRWVDDVPADQRDRFEAHFRARVDRLRAAGWPVPEAWLATA